MEISLNSIPFLTKLLIFFGVHAPCQTKRCFAEILCWISFWMTINECAQCLSLWIKMVNVQIAKVKLDLDLFLLMVCSGLGHTKSSDFLVFFLYCKYSTRSIMFAFTNKIQMTEGVSCVAGLRSQVSSFSSDHTFASFKSYMRKMFLRARERLCCAVNIIMAKWKCSAVIWWTCVSHLIILYIYFSMTVLRVLANQWAGFNRISIQWLTHIGFTCLINLNVHCRYKVWGHFTQI